MELERRAVLKASGVAALLGSTGLAGCSGVLNGGDGNDNAGGQPSGGPGAWQYDPTLLGDAPNTFFGSMDYATMYENREYFPEETRRSFEQTNSDSPVSPEDIDFASGVGGLSLSSSGQTGSGTGSVAVVGSFDKSAITDQVEQEDDASQVGEYEGYTLYESTSMDEQFGPNQDGSATIGIGDGALVVGFAFAAGTSPGATGQEAVETAIDSRNGNASRLSGNNQYATTVSDSVGEATVKFGAVGDPELIDQYASMADSQTQNYVDGLRAGGVGMTIQGETTEFAFVLAYESASAAEDTGLAALVEGAAPQIEEQEGINEISSDQSGGTITITATGDTRTLLNQANSTAGTGTGGF